MESLAPDINSGGACGPDAHADPIAFETVWTPLCHDYTLETTCNAQKHCIYDQTQSYIKNIDDRCETMPMAQCNGPCRKTSSGTCTTRTYCRAKTCRDVMFEQNVESLCLDINDPPKCNTKNTEWPDFCANATGAIRSASSTLGITDMTSEEIFYSCYMYHRRQNPALPTEEVPGSIPLNGILRVLGEDVLVRDIRKQFIDSRITLTSQCGLESVNIANTSFCTKHLQNVVPPWVITHFSQYDKPLGFFNWLVVCGDNVDSLWDTQSQAWERISDINKDCQVHYKSPGVEGSSWNSATEKQDSISYVAQPWTLHCLGQNPIEVESMRLDILPEEPSGCTWTSRQIEQQWGQTPWYATDVQNEFKKSCQEGLDIFAPTPTPVPNECDLGACGQGDQCFMCGEDVACEGNATVMCVADTSVHCLKDNRCQRGANCVQPKSMLYQAGYFCDWTPNTTVQVTIDNAIFTGQMTPQGVVSVSGIRDIISQKPNITIGTETKTIMRAYPTGDDEITFMWSLIQGERHNRGHSMLPKQPPCYGNFTNWYSFCDSQTLGYNLNTKGAFGLVSGWSGEAYHLSDRHVDVRSITYNKPHTFIKLIIDLKETHPDTVARITCDNVQSEWFMSGSSVNMQAEASTIKTDTDLTIEWTGNFKKCQVEGRFHPMLLLDITTNGTAVQPFSKSIVSVQGRDIHVPNETERFIAGYAAWSFSSDGSVRVQRSQNDILPQTATCSIKDGIKDMSSCGGDPPPLGMRWLLDSSKSQGDSSLRVHGWAKIEETESDVANMRILNAEFTQIAYIHVLKRRVYVNGQRSTCQVPVYEWWHWQIDVEHQDESPRTIMLDGNATRVYDQQWTVRIDIGGCTFSVEDISVSAGTVEHMLRGRLGEHTHTGPAESEDHCRVQCAAHETCLQWSYHEKHCYLSSTHCHNDPTCGSSKHTLRAVHSHKAKYFEVYNEARNVMTHWSSIRAEPLIHWNHECPAIDTDMVHPIWRESFKEYYEPFQPDATTTCNRLASQWTLMPEYPVRVCGEEDCSKYKNDLGACGRMMEYERPVIDTSQCTPSDTQAFMNLDWTSYCRYSTSFEEDRSGHVPFLVKDVNMEELCKIPQKMEDQVAETCETDIPTQWYQQCFSRTSSYEEFCSDQCLDTIEDMFANNGPDDPGLCERRKEYLDIRTNASGHDGGLSESCQCDMNNIIITDFCLMQNAYHDESGIKIPELYNSECSTKAPGCMDTLRNTLDRTEWRNWCKRLSENKIDGVCSYTACDCDIENVGVAGDMCELTCPHGLDDGQELACSGRNGKCFAQKPSEKTSDLSQQILNGEVRGGNVTAPTIPEWMKGPKPTMIGQCQCALGSGVACSIPCDRCNNGTYGEYMSSQYGICDSFNGICRGLAPFMRFNSKPSAPTEYLSYNTTSFETTQGQPAWTKPENFLFATDKSLMRRGLLSINDPDGRSTGVILPPSDIPILEDRFIQTMLPFFRTICGNQENADWIYLNQSSTLPFRGVQLQSESSIVLHTYTIPEAGRCTKISMGTHWYLCFVDGKMHARDQVAVTQGGSFGPMIVYETGNEDVPPVGITFSKWDSRTIYAFGGQRGHLNDRTIDTFNTLYRIDVKRQTWTPTDIILVHWSIQRPSGTPPRAQSYAPIVAFPYNLFVLATDNNGNHKLHECTLASGTREAKWHDPVDVPISGVTNGMAAIENSSTLYVSIGTKNMLYSIDNGTWHTPNGEMTTPALMETVDGWNARPANCTLEARNDTLWLGGNAIATFDANHVPATVSVHTEEWLTIDVLTNAETSRRVRNGIVWRVDDVKPLTTLLTESTDVSRSKVLDFVERIYMHQARWSMASSMALRARLTEHMGNDVKHTHYVRVQTENVSPMLEAFERITDALFSNTPRTSPTQFNVHIEGDMYHRIISISGEYSSNVQDYIQEIDMGEDIYQLECKWSLTSIELTLKQKFGDGFVSWSYTGEIRAFAILIRAEDWILSIDRSNMVVQDVPPSETGWRALFSLYVSHDGLGTYDMRYQTSYFLGYSSSHCSETASQECPGLLPYVNLPCSGHGRCNIGCQCECEVAPSILANDENALQDIDWQDSPWRGRGCEKTCPGFDGYNFDSICSGPARGKCMMDGTCACSQGFTGDACQFECPQGENGQICSAHGGCGTKGFERSSFIFNGDPYMDRLVAINRQQYTKALSSYYDPCLMNNFLEQKGEFPSDMDKTAVYSTKAIAQDACHTVNKELKLDLTREDLRYYPGGRCIGVEEYEMKYRLAILKMPEPLIVDIVLDSIFVCQTEDCTLQRSEEDEMVIVGLRETLRSPEYEFVVDYIHGQTNGQALLEVNHRQLRMDFNWTRSYVDVHIGDKLLVSRSGRFDRLVLKVVGTNVELTLYPSVLPIPHDTKTVWMSPEYDQKYRFTHDRFEGYEYLIENPDTGQEQMLTLFSDAELACDQDADCTGIVEWSSPKRESWYALLSHIQDKKRRVIDKEGYFRKMTTVYVGRIEEGDYCEPVRPGLAHFPSVQFTEKYDIPIQDLDLSLATDNDLSTDEDPVVEVGTGMWSNCWQWFSNIHDKKSCYEKAKSMGVFGFAYTNKTQVCIVYKDITSPTDIKLDMFNSETRLSVFNPCGEDTQWRPT